MKRIKEKRTEKKRRKLEALANIMKLNDIDRGITANEKDVRKNCESEVDKEPRTKKIKVDDASPANEVESQEQIKLLSKDQYSQLKRELRERKDNIQNIPRFHLREAGRRAHLDVPQNSRIPIFVTDIQHLLMSSLIGKDSPCKPERWCYLEKPLKLSHSLILVLNGFSLYHYLSNETLFQKFNEIFETKLEALVPHRPEYSIIQDLATVPLTNAQAEQLIEKYGSLETAIEMNKDPTLLVKTIFPVEEKQENLIDTDLSPGDKFPRTKLLLSALQMVDEGYPMPLQGELQERFKNYVFTKETYVPVNNKSPMFGIDCEMCRTSTGCNELTRISIVNEQLETVYETLVMPTNKITDYLTKYSGITAEMLYTVTKKLPEVQSDVQKLLPPDAILIGQSLNSDLHAMQMMHPYVIDTSIIFNLTGVRRKKSKLQTLARTFLDETIQVNLDGHDSVEDSKASMKLVKIKLANNLDYGDNILAEKKRLNEIIRATKSDHIKNNIFAHVAQRKKNSSIVSAGKLPDEIKNLIENTEGMKSLKYFELDTNKDAIQKTKEIILDNSLTIVNLTVNPENFKLDRIEKTVTKIDKWIRKLWKVIAVNGMFLVLMSGSSECPKGSLNIAIKANETNLPKRILSKT